MYNTQVIAELREMAKVIHDQLPHEQGEAAVYLQGGRDMLLCVAKLHEQSCPLAVLFFHSPVKVVEV